MSLEAALVAAIANGDHESRVVYRDWLEERGELERAEFLRLDDELAMLSPHAPEYGALFDRHRELAARHPAWSAEVGRGRTPEPAVTASRWSLSDMLRLVLDPRVVLSR